jgi:hypothetical protein
VRSSAMLALSACSDSSSSSSTVGMLVVMNHSLS